MYPNIVITGMGILSALGDTLEAQWEQLKHQKQLLSEPEVLNTRHKSAIKVGEIKRTNAQLAAQLGLPPENNYSRTALLAILSARQAIAQAQLTPDALAQTGLVFASTVGGMDMTERYLFDFAENPSLLSYLHTHPIGAVARQIATDSALGGLLMSVSTACSSAANAFITAANLLRTGRAEQLLVGGADALSKFTVNGFHSLMILSDSYCTPFDDNRKGLNLGEAGAFLVLETEEKAISRGATPLGRLVGWGNANDTFHQTASSEEGKGAFLAMQKALKVAQLPPDQIDYINAHGTATPNNDLSEARALLRLFGQNIPPFSSTKPYTGHTLGAASAVEAVFSLLALQHQAILPNLNFSTPMQQVPLLPATQWAEKPLKYVLSNSFGFGGNCSTLIFKR
jgi:3-oxoacyl-[acyl-carrier-protein] synthase II